MFDDDDYDADTAMMMQAKWEWSSDFFLKITEVEWWQGGRDDDDDDDDAPNTGMELLADYEVKQSVYVTAFWGSPLQGGQGAWCWGS